MEKINIEIKASCADPGAVEQFLGSRAARFAGLDHQTDTYFRVAHGRLKLRQGNIENNLIWYQRPDQDGPKQSDFRLVPVPDPELLKQVLADSCGILVEVRKHRQIWYIDHVKFHIDEVPGLGNFVEIEAFNEDGRIGIAQLRSDVDRYLAELGIQPGHLLSRSYSDMILQGC